MRVIPRAVSFGKDDNRTASELLSNMKLTLRKRPELFPKEDWQIRSVSEKRVRSPVKNPCMFNMLGDGVGALEGWGAASVLKGFASGFEMDCATGGFHYTQSYHTTKDVVVINEFCLLYICILFLRSAANVVQKWGLSGVCLGELVSTKSPRIS